ncbi:rhodanese-related sulfurtransferase [Rarobacter faecitabidus]|nr:rhodanese-related sulfurtransferase [Rarobacter faecitabidus]
MATHRIILFYGFTPIADPFAVKLWQRELAQRWNLTGRIIVAPTGINATLGGTVEALKRYVKSTKEYPGLGKIDVKWSAGTGDDFPRLSVKQRPELVAFGAPDEVSVTTDGVVGGGKHLAPQEVNDLVATRGEDVVFFDGRNAFEAQTGRFRGAIVPDAATTHDFITELESGKYDDLKGKAVVTYCTGGVRCEILSVLMKNRGFGEVYQIDGGIVRYGEAFGSTGLWEGSLYVFDGRGSLEFDAGSTSLGACELCAATTDRFLNCADAACTTQRLACEDCVPGQAFSDRCPACSTAREAWLPRTEKTSV